MQATTVGVGWIEILVFLLSGGGWLGLPPGDRDASLVKGAPQQSLVYLEWAGRSQGKPGASGIDGLVADPEIQAFLQSLDKSTAANADLDEDPDQTVRREALQWLKLVTRYPGCAYLTFDAPQPGQGLLKPATPAEILSRLHIGLISTAGKDAPLVLEGFNRVARTQVGAEPSMEQVNIQFGQSLTVHRERDRLLFGFGSGIVERSLAGLRGQLPGLESNLRFAEARKRIASPRLASLGWLDLRSSVEAALSSMGAAGFLVQAVWRGSGADALEFVISGTGVTDGTVVQRTFISTSGRTDGVMLLAGSPAIRLEQLRHIPADSDVVAALSLNLGQLVGAARDLISKTTPLSAAVFDEAIKELETELQLNLGTDVFPAFGNVWSAFDSPSQGGISGTSLILALEVRDPQKAQVVYDRLMQLLEQSLVAADSDPDRASLSAELKRQEFLHYSIAYLSHKATGFNSNLTITPSFCLTRNHLLVSLHPQAMKAHLRYLAASQPGFDTVAARKLPFANQELLAATYYDGQRAAQVFSGLAPFVGHALLETAHRGGLEFDSFAIPSAAAVVPYVGDMTMSIARQKDGILVEAKNPQFTASMVTILTSARSWFQHEYGDDMLSHAKQTPATDQATLGAAAGTVVPAAATQPEPKLQEKPGSVAARKLAPLVLKALIPDDVQPMIPNEIFRKLEQPPSQEVLQQREERRRLQEERRRERLERRRGRGPAPMLKPLTPPVTPRPPIPNPPPTAPAPNP